MLGHTRCPYTHSGVTGVYVNRRGRILLVLIIGCLCLLALLNPALAGALAELVGVVLLVLELLDL